MTSDVATLSQLPFIDAFRKEISAKCTKIRSGPSQSVEVLKIEMDDRPIPVFVKIELPEERQDVHAPSAVEVLKYQGHVSNPSKRKRLLKKDPITGKIHCLVPTCKEEFNELSKARYHFDRVHSSKTFNKCSICNVKVYKYSSSLWAHKRTCRKQLEKKMKEKKTREGFKFRCPICRKKFATNSQRAVHQRRCHSRNDKFSCDICHKTFSYSDTLKEHKDAIHFKNVKKCKHCKNEFIHSRSHRRHEKNCLQSSARKRPEGKFKQNSTKMFICPSCPKVFKSFSSVQIHFDSIHLQNKYPCDICKMKVFSHKVSLQKHQESCRNTLQKRLDREKLRMGFKYQCDICENKFKCPSKLLSHKNQVHFNERKFPCGACDKVFKRQDHLDRHKSKTNCKQSTNENVLIIKLEGEEVI